MANRYTYAEIERLRHTSAYIREHLHTRLRLSDLCKLALMNRHRLNGGFKKLYGQRLFEYVRSQRMALARELVHETDTSLDEIAMLTGYDYVNNFLVAYKQYYGYSAVHIRKI